MCKTERKKRTKMCCIKRSHNRGTADDEVRKLENIDNFGSSILFVKDEMRAT